MRERRAFIRHPTEIPIEVAEEGLTETERNVLRDVSLGGLCCHLARALPEGSIVQVRVPFVKPTFETRARVVWCRVVDREFDVGVQFLDADDAFRARMVEQICHIEQYRREIRATEGRELTSEDAAAEWIAKFAPTFPQTF